MVTTASTSAADRDTTTSTLPNETAATTDAPVVESITLSDGAVSLVTLDVPSGTQAVVAPTAPANSVPLNTNAGIPSSTTGLIRPTSTNASAASATHQNSASQQNDGSAGGLSRSAKIGLGVGLGVGIPLLLAIIAGLFIWRRRRHARRQLSPQYGVRGQLGGSMMETSHACAMAGSREALRPGHDELLAHLGIQPYHYQPPPPTLANEGVFQTPVSAATQTGQDAYFGDQPDQAYQPLPSPTDTFVNEDAFQPPVGAVARSGLGTPTIDGRPTSRHIPGTPTAITIPPLFSTPLHSRNPSIDGGVSPVSPVSPVSGVSSIGSRAPSPQHQEEPRVENDNGI